MKKNKKSDFILMLPIILTFAIYFALVVAVYMLIAGVK